MTKTIYYYSIILGISIFTLWIMILTGEGMPEGRIESTFHLISEFIMASICIFGGILSLKGLKYSTPLLISGNAMVVYSVLNAAGYYGQNSGLVMTIPFIVMALVSGFIIIYYILKST